LDEEEAMLDAMTMSMQDYLETILTLSDRGAEVTVSEIAACLGVANASVSQAIGRLRTMGLVNHRRYGHVELTVEGRQRAETLHHRHRVLKEFMTEVLKLENTIAERDACRIEHVVSPQTIEALVEFLAGQPRSDIGSQPQHQKNATQFPEEEDTMNATSISALSELSAGQAGRVVSVGAKGEVRRRLLEMGIIPGIDITVQRVAPMGDPLAVTVRGYQLSLRREEAKEVYVERQPDENS
jgi:DtxR family Mn-dependent transcriptional regulator